MSLAPKHHALVLAASLLLPLAACSDDGGSEDDVGTESNGDTTGDTTEDSTTDGTSTDTTESSTDTTDTTESSTDTTDTTDTTGGTDTTDGTDTGMMDTTDTTGGALSFEADIWPIIEPNCSCHVGGSGGLIMADAATAYANLVDVPSVHDPNIVRVAPGDGDNSFIYQKITATQQGLSATNAQMPKSFGQAMSNNPLPDADQMLIWDWINEGANP